MYKRQVCRVEADDSLSGVSRILARDGRAACEATSCIALRRGQFTATSTTEQPRNFFDNSCAKIDDFPYPLGDCCQYIRDRLQHTEQRCRKRKYSIEKRNKRR